MKRTPREHRLNKEQVLEAAKLSNPEARLLVANYYEMQEMRKRSDMQVRHVGDKETTPQILLYSANVSADVENTIKLALKKFAEANPVGAWSMAQIGVAEVITAGLLAHVDIEQAPTVGHVWSFAGLNPKQEWKKGEKRPFNAALKQLAYHLGECIKRSSNHPDSIYGKIYRERKELLVKRNDEGYNAERAKTFFTKSAEVKKKLAEGKLPDGNLDRQACNYAAKIFLSHFHAVLYWHHFKKAPPKPFAIQHLGHAHEIKIPSLEMFPGLAEAYYGVTLKTASEPKRKVLEAAE